MAILRLIIILFAENVDAFWIFLGQVQPLLMLFLL